MGLTNVTDNNILNDPSVGVSASIDTFRNLRVAQAKRVIGSNFGSTIDTTYLYTTSVAGTGTATASNGVASLTTGATANSSASIVTKNKARYLSGRNNLFRFQGRFSNTGSANNVREVGVFIDSSNQFVFRLSGTTFQVVVKKAGVETVVSSGLFNGNGSSSGMGWTVDTNFHAFEILYSTARIRFLIDNDPIHTFVGASTSLTSSLVGQIYAANTNSGGGTANVSLDFMAVSVSHIGDAVNNPNYYNINAVAETRTLKGGGGTLQSISIGRPAGVGSSLTIYDNTAGSGTVIGIWDLNNAQSVGTHVMGIEGVNFYNGLTYVTAGTMTNGSITIFWE